MALVYFLMSLLCILLGTALVRYVVFTVVWVVSGHSLWLFPNMMDDQVKEREGEGWVHQCSLRGVHDGVGGVGPHLVAVPQHDK